MQTSLPCPLLSRHGRTLGAQNAIGGHRLARAGFIVSRVHGPVGTPEKAPAASKMKRRGIFSG